MMKFLKNKRLAQWVIGIVVIGLVMAYVPLLFVPAPAAPREPAPPELQRPSSVKPSGSPLVREMPATPQNSGNFMVINGVRTEVGDTQACMLVTTEGGQPTWLLTVYFKNQTQIQLRAANRDALLVPRVLLKSGVSGTVSNYQSSSTYSWMFESNDMELVWNSVDADQLGPYVAGNGYIVLKRDVTATVAGRVDTYQAQRIEFACPPR